MKISQIIQETSTTAGSVAPVEHGFVKMQTRNPGVYGNSKVGNLLKGKKTNKAFANSVNESAEISETDLSEQDLIVVPGQGRNVKTGFVPHDKDRTDHEVEMAVSDLFSAGKNAEKIYNIVRSVSEDEGLEGWVQEKIIKANDYLNTVREYLEGKQLQSVTENNQRGDSLVTDALKLMRGAEVTDAVKALKTVLGDREYNSRRGFYNFYIRQMIDAYGKQGVAEGLNDTIYPNAEVIKSKNGKPVGEIYQDGNSWGCFHYRADRGYDLIDSREDAIEALKDLHQETGRSRPDYTVKGVAEGEGNKYGSQENWDSLRKDIRSQYPYKKGTNVTVPHKGKLVNGKIVRYEAGKGGYSPTYVVDIGEYESIMVPPNKVRRDATESLGTTGAMTNGEMGESQLDELSPQALGSYVKSAAGDMAKRTGNTQFQKGARVATSAFNSKQSPSRFEKDSKIEKRQDGINRAVNKLTSKK